MRDKLRPRVPPATHDDPDPIAVISRLEWAAREPARRSLRLKPPLTHIAFTSTGSEECFSFLECCNLLQGLQDLQMNSGQPDIAYNFMVCSEGDVFEGRGWTRLVQVDPKYKDIKAKILVVAYIGEFTDEPPTTEMLASTAILLSNGIKGGLVHPTFMRLPFTPIKLPTTKTA